MQHTLASRRRGGARALGLTVAIGVAVTGLVNLPAASAAVPAFPDNVVVFPDRDFVTIEGYQDRLGETATVEVKRAGVVIGSAQSVVGPGDVAFEINHPGGVCWGAGTTHKVTPDIRPGDDVSIRFGAGEPDTTTTADAFVDSDATLSGTTLTVKGHIGATVNRNQFEQRIINPDLVDTDVARRDIRALPGPMTPAPKGGYSSGVTFDGDTFTATYQFNDAATAAIAVASGGERAMSWQNEDGDANRQGLTIAEHGELGGPGMGGCPNGPADQAAPASSYSFVRSADKSKLAVSWTPATPAPGAPEVTGYSVEAIAPADGSGVSATVGARTPATGKTTTLAVDPAVDYRIEVRSLAGPRMGEAFTLAPTSGTHPLPVDQSVPNLAFTPAPAADGSAVEADSVTLASENTADIYYTTDGTPVIDGGLPSDNATLYAGPIPITQAISLHAVAFDRAGNFSEQVVKYTPVTVKAPLAAPTGLKATAGQGSVKLDWSAVTGATSYQVAATSPAGAVTVPSTTTLTQTVTGLTAGTTYAFTVTASDGTRTSAPSAPVSATPVAVTARVVISTGRWKNADARVSGTTNTAANAGTIRFYRATATGTASTTTFGGTAGQVLTAAVAPGTGSTFDARFRTTALTGTTNPGAIVAVLSDSTGKVLGTSAAFTLANG